MSKLNDLLIRLRNDWQDPRRANVRGEISPFKMICNFSRTGVPEEQLQSFNHSLPDDLIDLWTNFSSAKLFLDSESGQWGLEILSPKDALIETELFIENRKKDYINGDLVLGRFLGDSDLLIVRCNQSSDDYGGVIIALPIDPRNEWYFVSTSLTSFFKNYIDSNGDKYWEIEGTGYIH